MRKIQCEICKRSVALTSGILASAALDMETRFDCRCGSTLEVLYIDDRLVSASVGRIVQFRASGGLQIEKPKYMEGR